MMKEAFLYLGDIVNKDEIYYNNATPIIEVMINYNYNENILFGYMTMDDNGYLNILNTNRNVVIYPKNKQEKDELPEYVYNRSLHYLTSSDEYNTVIIITLQIQNMLTRLAYVLETGEFRDFHVYTHSSVKDIYEFAHQLVLKLRCI